MGDFLILWGGQDVDSSFYKTEKSKYCGITFKEKDAIDIACINKAIIDKIPIIGICRGAQILNVANGGVLVQHIEDHAINGTHTCTILNDTSVKEMQVSSTHHQMMIAHHTGIIIGYSNHPVDGVHWEKVNEFTTYDFVTEIVYYPKTKSLCIQPHPEYMNQDCEFVQWINKFIKKEFDLDPINFKELYYGKNSYAWG